ncbi:hypothetical protein [Thermococcus sp.]|uniref:hypothetical protein n=1 Tax=Thermococcus sp. TaxID=35749 RepID=UPI0025D3DA2F|nr:hypothetical protein [Thermococcus sp.]
MKFFIYNAAGLTIPVEAKPGVPFKFQCPEEECGKVVVIEGVIRDTNEGEFDRVVGMVVGADPDFARIREITEKTWIFYGKVNGEDTTLPAESFDEFAKRFLDEVLVLR